MSMQPNDDHEIPTLFDTQMSFRSLFVMSLKSFVRWIAVGFHGLLLIILPFIFCVFLYNIFAGAGNQSDRRAQLWFTPFIGLGFAACLWGIYHFCRTTVPANLWLSLLIRHARHGRIGDYADLMNRTLEKMPCPFSSWSTRQSVAFVVGKFAHERPNILPAEVLSSFSKLYRNQESQLSDIRTMLRREKWRLFWKRLPVLFLVSGDQSGQTYTAKQFQTEDERLEIPVKTAISKLATLEHVFIEMIKKRISQQST